MQPSGRQPFDEELRGLIRGASGLPKDPCPDTQQWALLAAGLPTSVAAGSMLAHAGNCAPCSELLKHAVEAMSEQTPDPELSKEEAMFLSSLASAQPEWQRRMARQMRDANSPGGWSPPFWRQAAAAALLLAAGSGMWLYWQRQADPERLLARAYTAKRVFEYRIGAAEFAPVRVERAGGSTFDRPPELLEAQAIISRKLAVESLDPHWLALEGRAEMLTSNYDAAIAALERARDSRPADADLLAALGCAKALRGDAGPRAVDYAAAAELLTQSLERRPGVPEVIFNRALVYERMFLYDEAVRDWNRYLALDTTGAWANEARQHLARVEQKKKPGQRP